MKTKIFSVLSAVALATCTGQRVYSNNDLELVVAHSARDACSCIFVMGMDEKFCKAWVKASPDVARWSVDRVNKTTEASAFITTAATAKFVNDEEGCILQ